MTGKFTGSQHPGMTDEQIAELVGKAGSRPRAADYGLSDFKVEAEARWLGVVERRRRRKRLRLAVAVTALAATLASAWIGGRLWLGASPRELGMVALATEGMMLTRAGSTVPLALGDAIAESAEVRTGEAGGAIRLESGVEVRLDRHSSMRFEAVDRFRVESGAVFVDTDAAVSGRLLIETDLGSIRDIGTTFQVTARDREIAVIVRRGRVEVRRPQGRTTVDSGQRATLVPSVETVLSTAPEFGPAWDWVLAASPPFALEGADLGSYLDWLQHETGWEPEFEGVDPEAARSLILHGSLADLSPGESVALVLPSCGLAHRLDGNRLVISEQGP